MFKNLNKTRFGVERQSKIPCNTNNVCLLQIMSGGKASGGSGSNKAPTVDVPILGLLQTDGDTKDYTNITIDKLPKVIT